MVFEGVAVRRHLDPAGEHKKGSLQICYDRSDCIGWIPVMLKNHVGVLLFSWKEQFLVDVVPVGLGVDFDIFGHETLMGVCVGGYPSSYHDTLVKRERKLLCNVVR